MLLLVASPVHGKTSPNAKDPVRTPAPLRPRRGRPSAAETPVPAFFGSCLIDARRGG